jgi:hypothetical protein
MYQNKGLKRIASTAQTRRILVDRLVQRRLSCPEPVGCLRIPRPDAIYGRIDQLLHDSKIQAVVEPDIPAEMLAVVLDVNGAELTIEAFDKAR